MKINEFVTQEEIDALDEKATKALCTSAKPNSALGASNLSSCKSQGLRAREGEKLYKSGGKRQKIAGKKIKGGAYGGPPIY